MMVVCLQVVIAFRGTASLANMRSDMQVGNQYVPLRNAIMRDW